jgi:hypothetical protein
MRLAISLLLMILLSWLAAAQQAGNQRTTTVQPAGQTPMAAPDKGVIERFQFLITGLVVLIADGIAYRGVLKQIRAAAERLGMELQANREREARLRGEETRVLAAALAGELKKYHVAASGVMSWLDKADSEKSEEITIGILLNSLTHNHLIFNEIVNKFGLPPIQVIVYLLFVYKLADGIDTFSGEAKKFPNTPASPEWIKVFRGRVRLFLNEADRTLPGLMKIATPTRDFG